MNRPKNNRCIVCAAPCSGRVCSTCFHTKSNKHAGRYQLREYNLINTMLDRHKEDN